MYIIIDGYNLFHAARLTHKALSKQQLIQKIINYHKKRGHQIILVFDAGQWLNEDEKYESGITILHSGQVQSADAAIIRYVKEKLRQKETLLISSDNALCQAVRQYTVSSIDSELFYTIMMQRINEQSGTEKNGNTKQIIKYSTETNEMLDLLMTGSVPADKDVMIAVEDNFLPNDKKKSKIDKVMMAILKKL